MEQKEQYLLNELLLQAVASGDEEQITEAISEGADIHVDDDRAFSLAEENGHTKVLELLKQKAKEEWEGLEKWELDDHLAANAAWGNKYYVMVLLECGATNDYALHLAEENGHTEVVELLKQHMAQEQTQEQQIKEGGNVMNQLEQDRLNTLLIDAAESGDADKVIELLDRGANVHAQDDWALFYAAWGDHKEIVELLLDRGADIHAGGDRALLNAIINGYTETVELLLNRGADVHVKNDLALRCAANYGHPEVVELLKQHMAQEQTQEQQIKEGENVMNQQEQFELNDLLIEAAENGDKDKVIELLDRGADIHAISTDRMHEVWEMSHEMEISYENFSDEALRSAAREGHTEVVELLLDRGADVHAQDDYALIAAAEQGHKEVVELLLDRGADVHADDDAALREAAEDGRTEVVEFLLDRGADVHADDDAALREAAQEGHKEVVELLLDRGADVHARDDEALRDAAGANIMQHTAWRGHKKVVESHPEVVELLLDRGADIHVKNDLALRSAAKNGHAEMVELLLDRGADIHADNDAVLMYAVDGGRTELIELLLDRGSDIHARDDYALISAARDGRTKLVELLLDRGADVHARDDVALSRAEKNGRTKMVELLKQHMAQEQAIGKTVGEFIKEHPQTTLELMTPDGYVLLNAEIMQKAIERNGKIYPNLGFRGSEYETELNDILSQYINSINPKEDDPNYLYMMTADQFEDVQFETGGKTMESTNETAIPITLTGNREGEILQDQNQTKGEQTMDVKQENQNKSNEGVKNMEQISNETKNKSETPINPIELKAKSPEGKIIEIGAKVTQGIKDLFDSEKYKEYLQVMSKFHNYSLKNTVLIAMQMPTATKVTNFNTWKFGLGRTVKKGEQGMKIMSPMPVKSKQAIEKLDPQTDKPVLDDAGNPITEEKEITTTAVKVTTVFDVSQTEGKDLENSNTPTKDFYTAVEKVSNVPIDAKDGNDQEKIKEAINEITNTKLQTLQDQSPNAIDEHTREIQAASVAYTVCQHYGLDTSNYSFDNVSEWSNGRKFTELRNTLETIHTAADNIIEDINQNVMAIAKSKEQAQEQEPRPYHEPVNDKLAELKHEQMQEQNKEQKKTYEMER